MPDIESFKGDCVQLETHPRYYRIVFWPTKDPSTRQVFYTVRKPHVAIHRGTVIITIIDEDSGNTCIFEVMNYRTSTRRDA